jgi:hypothetical protein
VLRGLFMVRLELCGDGGKYCRRVTLFSTLLRIPNFPNRLILCRSFIRANKPHPSALAYHQPGVSPVEGVDAYLTERSDHAPPLAAYDGTSNICFDNLDSVRPALLRQDDIVVIG